ncbi:hypothetical protein NVV31_11690 [Cytobacillus firmus]|jgi:hypothetical protein|uniref:hypothetical protein n=1 Tax=Cytobacillus firmus TaxID=1399 RepID=UPI0021C6B27E|nr:hypothetical protein [Cytobacillus firmus]MCU1806040.1 hypothetical protein [Cytobacillus firmus]
MEQRKWIPIKEMDGSNTLVWGDKPEVMPEQAFISLTRGEGLNLIQLFINQVLTLLVMNQMKKTPGLLYAELNGELKKWKGTGQTMTVWDGKLMPKFRNHNTHGFAMKFFTWIIHRKNTKNYYLTYSANETIPTVPEVREILRKYGKFYDGGVLARKAAPPKFEKDKKSS